MVQTDDGSLESKTLRTGDLFVPRTVHLPRSSKLPSKSSILHQHDGTALMSPMSGHRSSQPLCGHLGSSTHHLSPKSEMLGTKNRLLEQLTRSSEARMERASRLLSSTSWSLHRSESPEMKRMTGYDVSALEDKKHVVERKRKFDVEQQHFKHPRSQKTTESGSSLDVITEMMVWLSEAVGDLRGKPWGLGFSMDTGLILPSAQQLPVQQVEDPSFEIKLALVNAVSLALIVGLTWKKTEGSACATIIDLATRVALKNPEFILKLAVWARRELGLRQPTCLLLALAAHLPSCQPYMARYGPVAILLPTDWTEVPQVYQTLFGHNLPACLRRALTLKFAEFDEYQLGKYNRKPKKPKKLKWKALQEEEENKRFTLKNLICRLHISKPTYHVMCLLEKRYPADLEAFRRSGLPGLFQADQANCRMRIAMPQTWETQLPLRGNNAAVWEQLIDDGKLPFMAMLRNLRNLLLAGISSQHHEKILNKLTDKKAVVGSRQFPFRFFTAYEVLEDLERKIPQAVHPLPSVRQQMRGRMFDEEICIKLKRRRKILQKLSCCTDIASWLQRYRSALDTALKIATTYNIPRLPGTTVILCNFSQEMSFSCFSARGLGKAHLVIEVAVLIGLMIKFCSEQAHLFLYGAKCCHEVQLETGTVLENMKRLLEQQELDFGRVAVFPSDVLRHLIFRKQKVERLVVLDLHHLDPEVLRLVAQYRRLVYPGLLLVHSSLIGSFRFETPLKSNSNDIYLHGYSEQIFRFLAERGSAKLLGHIDLMDKMYKVPLPEDKLLHRDELALTPTPHVPPTVRWRVVRVFISSTFRDMHGERDLLTRFVIPQLRSRAAARCLEIREVDLRWGLTAQDSYASRQLEVCLAEANRADLFVGLLGNRYGHVVQDYTLPDEPHFNWVRFALVPLSLSAFTLKNSNCLIFLTTLDWDGLSFVLGDVGEAWFAF
uniref:TROVE domain-containing protein n=2 Tax=Eptatretus burgeri TaxID=7764 RepID=A0A8C4PWU5_EPTBU